MFAVSVIASVKYAHSTHINVKLHVQMIQRQRPYKHEGIRNKYFAVKVIPFLTTNKCIHTTYCYIRTMFILSRVHLIHIKKKDFLPHYFV